MFLQNLRQSLFHSIFQADIFEFIFVISNFLSRWSSLKYHMSFYLILRM